MTHAAEKSISDILENFSKINGPQKGEVFNLVVAFIVNNDSVSSTMSNLIGANLELSEALLTLSDASEESKVKAAEGITSTLKTLENLGKNTAQLNMSVIQTLLTDWPEGLRREAADIFATIAGMLKQLRDAQ